MNPETITPNYYLTDHFLFEEFVCPCCHRVKLIPGFWRHVALLEQLRQMLDMPIIITSGYRCPEHNRAINGAPLSWHMQFATDAKPETQNDETLQKMYDIAEDLGFGGIGRYSDRLHLDLRPEPARWRG